MPEEKMSKQQQQLKEITERLEKGVQELFSTEQYTEYLRVMSQFHNYSFSNILLIAMQKPDATLVAGYGAWQKKFERNVMRGEKAIKIFAPAPRKVEVEREVLDPVTQRPVLDENGEPLKETVTVKKPYFKIASVFDVSQTEGKPLPELAEVQELTGSVEGYNLFFDALCRTSSVPVAFEPISGSTHGYYHQVEKRIAIAEGMSEAQNVKTAIHEIAHSRLHDVDMMDEANGIMIDRRTREVQAESVAYTVCQHYGIDTSDYSFGYIAGWSEGREMKELRSSMEVIRREADSMIKAIDANLEELRREQELAAENPFVDEQTFAAETPFVDEQAAAAETPFVDEQAAAKETPFVEGQAEEADSGNISQESGEREIRNSVEQTAESSQTGKSEVSVKEGEAIAADQPFSEAVNTSSMDEELTAEDITNFKGMNREYYAASRTRIYTFACDVQGERDTLTYELSYHDDGDGFTLHTGKNDIWERMSMRELRRLENVVSQEAILYDWQQEISEADSVEAVHDLRYSFYDTENLSLSDANIDRLVSMLNEKERELNGSQEIGSDAPEKVTIGSFFVERDPHDLGDNHFFQTFSDLDSALGAYAALPNHIDKDIGMESTEQPPSRMTLIQCKNGMETLTDMEFESLSGKWITEESQEAWHRAQFFLDNHDTEIAYRAGNRYFTIQNTDGGYDYTFYDKAFHELDGGVYDNPDVSIREAVDDILEDMGLSFEQCEVIDHGELTKFVEAVRIGDITVVTEEENDSIPLVSDHTEPDAALGGRSRAEIEETVLSMAQAELDEMGLSEDVKLLGARVYGSRTREGLYQEGSDVDVVLSYTGGIKESAFFNTLHESGLQMAGMTVDVNPISLEETGTLEDYLFRSEAYLDEKEAKMRAAKEAEKEPTISFYVAECSEFTNLGEYHDNLTLEEAVRIFDTIPPDRMSAIPCIGFCLSDGSMYDGEFPLMEAGEVLSDIINDIAHYRESPLVQQAIKDMQAILDERALQRGVIPVSHLNSYSEAKEAGEVDSWRASHRENERCAHEFSNDFGYAYHDRKMPEYLQKWVQKYGMERCKIVLASTIQLADYDGRYYPSTKEEAAKVVVPGADTQDTYKDRRQDYRVSTHPVMVNGAFRQLLAMEREQQEQAQAQTTSRTQEKESAQPQSKAAADPQGKVSEQLREGMSVKPQEGVSAQERENVSEQSQGQAEAYPKNKSVDRTQKKPAAEQDAKAPSGSLLSRLQDKQKQVEAAKQTPGKTQDKKRGVEI